MSATCSVCGFVLSDDPNEDLWPVKGTAGVCGDCLCSLCDGDKLCNCCCGDATCPHCGVACPKCEKGACPECDGRGFTKTERDGDSDGTA